MVFEKKSPIRSFIQKEIVVAKLAATIGGLLAIVIFVLGNSIGQTVTEETVGLAEVLLYFLRTTFALFLLGSMLNLVFQIAGALTSHMRTK